jgi:Flp pilus assembly protein TadD
VAAQTLLGVVYVEQKKYSLARATLERAVQLKAKDLRAHYQLGSFTRSSGRSNMADVCHRRPTAERAARRENYQVQVDRPARVTTSSWSF